MEIISLHSIDLPGNIAPLFVMIPPPIQFSLFSGDTSNCLKTQDNQPPGLLY